MHILISGTHGMVGSELLISLRNKGHRVASLCRFPDLYSPSSETIYWNPSEGKADLSQLEAWDAVIHLAGENIAGRWNAHKKASIFKSRCRDTWTLCQLLTRLKEPPKTFICASAVGYYGDRQEEELKEESPAGSGFLADLCVQWEKSTESLKPLGVRVVNMRFGAILSEKGGLLPKLIRPIKWHLGVYLGEGNNFISWIALEDVVAGIDHLLKTPSLTGPVNFTAPYPVTQNELIQTIVTLLHGKAPFRLSNKLVKLLLGEMGQEMVLASQKVVPQKLMVTGYSFVYPDLNKALAHLLK